MFKRSRDTLMIKSTLKNYHSKWCFCATCGAHFEGWSAVKTLKVSIFGAFVVNYPFALLHPLLTLNNLTLKRNSCQSNQEALLQTKQHEPTSRFISYVFFLQKILFYQTHISSVIFHNYWFSVHISCCDNYVSGL